MQIANNKYTKEGQHPHKSNRVKARIRQASEAELSDHTDATEPNRVKVRIRQASEAIDRQLSDYAHATEPIHKWTRKAAHGAREAGRYARNGIGTEVVLNVINAIPGVDLPTILAILEAIT